MKAFPFGLAALALTAQPVAAATPTSPGLFLSHLENVLGTSFDVKIIAANCMQAQLAEAAILTEINRLQDILSSYHPHSEWCRWLRTTAPTVVSEDLWNILTGFDYWQAQTQGAIHAAAEAINQFWQHAATQQRLPSNEELTHTLATVQQPHWKLEPDTRTATRLTQVPLRLHTFVKSYILDKAAQKALDVQGVSALVLNIGGDLVVRGNWTETVQLTHPGNSAENSLPMDCISLQNHAVATSGTYRRGVAIQGEWFSHLVDPRTALPVSHIRSATVVHPDATTAGALATAFTVLSPTASAQLASRFPGTEYLLVAPDGQQYASQGWSQRQMTPPASAVMQAPTTVGLLSLPALKDKTWNPDEELSIAFELSRFEGRSHRPFVAVWIEDSKHTPIRQLALWYNKPRWLPELRTWYAHKQKAGTDASAVTAATRSAGNYTLLWDGKDDAGNYVKQGRYFICIEAAREHGTHQLIRQPMECNGRLKQENVHGNVEVKTATLDYRKKNTGN